MANQNQSVREFLMAIKQEPVKMLRVYDATNRLATQYEAVTHAKNGDPCMKTEYTYDGTSSRVVKLKESVDIWLLAYDL